jgi:transposase
LRARSRAHSRLLSAAGTPIQVMAHAYQVHRGTVSAWITQWEQHGAQSWPEHPRRGRPSTLTPDAQALAHQYIQEDPRSLHGGGERFARTTETRLSLSTLKRLAKKARLRWQRVRKSCKRLRDPKACARGQRARAAWQPPEDQGQIALYDFDASGFALEPTLPYAWHEPQRVIARPAMRAGRRKV